MAKMADNKDDKRPMYEQIYEILAQEIYSQALQPGDHFITLDEICTRFNTSKITARRAIMELAKHDLIYTKRGAGIYVASTSSKQSNAVSFFVNGISQEGALPLVIRGSERVARELGFHLLLCNTEGDQELGRQYAERLIKHEIQGAIVKLPNDMKQHAWLDEVILKLEAHRVPVVLADLRFLEGHNHIPYVVADNYGGTIKAVEHMCNLGHHRIAGIFEDRDSAAIERMEGFRGAVLKCGMDSSSELVKNVYIHEDYDRCYGIVDELLALSKPPTAIFCHHDLIAQKVMSIIQERGLRIPEDIAIIGFDDLPFSKFLNPPLTTVRQPLEEMGAEAMRVIAKRIKNLEYRPHIRFNTELVVRNSCGAQLINEKANTVQRETKDVSPTIVRTAAMN